MVLVAMSHFVNATGICQFGWWSNDPSYIHKFTKAVTGWECDQAEAQKAGDALPTFVTSSICARDIIRAWTYAGVIIGDPPIGVGPLAEVTVALESLEREWLEAYHWDVNTTKPDPEHLKNIGIPELAKELGLS